MHDPLPAEPWTTRTAPDIDAAPDGTDHDEQDLYEEAEASTAKVELDSPHIWWWRDRPFSPDEPDGRYRRKADGVAVEAAKDAETEEGHDAGRTEA